MTAASPASASVLDGDSRGDPSGAVPELRRARRRARFVGLDALRGIAVLLVVVYHAWPEVLPAGFLGVSLFFTLSGFLITHVLLGEHEATGGVSIRSFWVRRLRRLMPAALLGLGAISLAWWRAGWLTAEIAGDIGASLAYLANLRFLSTATAYGGESATSPVLHFWSLAIEEQFYVVFPLIAAVTLRSRWTTRAFAAALLALVAISVAVTARWAGDTMTIYFSTTARAAEILVGALAALAVHRWPALTRRAITAVLGVAGLAALLLASAATRLDDGLYAHGGLLAAGVASTLVILAAAGVTRLPAPIRPLVFLGTISYALYVVHWPILMALRELDRTSSATVTVALAASVVLAWASTRYLEMPIRARRWPTWRVRVVAIVAAAAVGVSSITGMALAPSATEDLAAAASDIDELTRRSVQRAARPRPEADVAADPAVTILVLGDSTALTLADAAQFAGDERLDLLGGYAPLGCTIARGGERRGDPGKDGGSPIPVDECSWDVHWLQTVEAVGPVDVALISAGIWETTERQIPGVTDGWTTLDDPAYAEHLYTEILAATDALAAAGVDHVVWTTVAGNPQKDLPLYDQRRAIVNDLFRQAAAARPDTAAVIELAAHLDAPQNEGIRPDGVHVDRTTGASLWDSWLLDQVVDVRDSASGSSSPREPSAH